MNLPRNWRNRLNILVTILIVMTVLFVAFTLIQWIRSDPGSYEPLNVLAATLLSIFTAFSAWLSRDRSKSEDFTSTSPQIKRFDLGDLRKQMTEYFDLTELQSLCFDLGIDFDEIEGDTKTIKTVSILEYIQRHNQLEELLNHLQQARPNVNWQNLAFPTESEIRNRLNFLRNVQATWIDGYLKNSLSHTAELDLKLTIEFDAVARKTPIVLGQTEQQLGQSLCETFNKYGRSLLILGEPGNGKTITLLSLGADLLAYAQTDLSQPMPVILNLSSWGQKQEPFSHWLVNEIFLQYQVSRNLVRFWIDNNQLLFLLDGLDEVPENHRDSCVEAINSFRTLYPSDFVVCSRIVDYMQMKNRLNVALAVRIHPLSNSQVDKYLTGQGVATKAVRTSLQSDPELLDLAKTPLFLRIMTLAYQGLSHDELKPLASIESRRQHLLNHYIQAVFKRRPLDSNSPYNQNDAINWLANLASQMHDHNQSSFRFEDLQSSWLPSKALPIYRVLVGLVVGLLVGFWCGLIFLLISTLLGQFPFGLIMGMVFCLSGGLSIALSQKLAMFFKSSAKRILSAGFSSWVLFGFIFSLLNLSLSLHFSLRGFLR